MKQIKHNWKSTGAAVVGVVIALTGFSAVAQSGHVDAPTYGDWFKIVTGLVVALVAAYAKGVESRVTKTESRLDSASTRITDLRELLAGQHYDKEEIDRRFDRIEQMVTAARNEASSGLSALHRRLDFLRVPPATFNGENGK